MARDAKLKVRVKEVAALKRKKAKLPPQKITCKGKAKLVGRKSTLERMGKLSKKTNCCREEGHQRPEERR
eukprot:1672785-Pyramimonas_sp.AAC.1